jgi:hypothetical protein
MERTARCLQDELIKVERVSTESNTASVTEYFEKKTTEHADEEAVGAILPDQTHLS